MVHKHLKHFFPHPVSCNCFVEMEKEICSLGAVFIKRFCWRHMRALKENPVQKRDIIGRALSGYLFLNCMQPVAKVENDIRNSLMSIAGKS